VKIKLAKEAEKALKDAKKRLAECEDASVKAQKRAEAAAALATSAEQEVVMIDEQIVVSRANGAFDFLWWGGVAG